MVFHFMDPTRDPRGVRPEGQAAIRGTVDRWATAVVEELYARG
jgi:hypothetical protein